MRLSLLARSAIAVLLSGIAAITTSCGSSNGGAANSDTPKVLIDGKDVGYTGRSIASCGPMKPLLPEDYPGWQNYLDYQWNAGGPNSFALLVSFEPKVGGNVSNVTTSIPGLEHGYVGGDWTSSSSVHIAQALNNRYVVEGKVSNDAYSTYHDIKAEFSCVPRTTKSTG